MKKYILAIDIGNTNTVFGLFNGSTDNEILNSWRTVTRRDRTSDELGIFLLGFLQSHGVDPTEISGAIYSSVVPPLNPIVERMCVDYFSCTPSRVRHDNVPIEFVYPRPDEIGADRLVNAIAAKTLFPGNHIIVDLGTATTFCLLKDGKYWGGAIAPGLKLSMEALSRNTAQLPPIEFSRPIKGVIGDTTLNSMKSGFFFGWLGLLRGVIHEMKAEYPSEKFETIGTGGLSTMIHKEASDVFDIVDTGLTLKGLKIIYSHIQENQANQ